NLRNATLDAPCHRAARVDSVEKSLPGEVFLEAPVRKFIHCFRSRATKRSNRNEGTRSLATNAVGIRRQAGRGADGCCAVDRVGWAVGAVRAVAAGGGAAFPLPRS